MRKSRPSGDLHSIYHAMNKCFPINSIKCMMTFTIIILFAVSKCSTATFGEF